MSRVRINVSIPEEDLAAIDLAAEAAGLSRSGYLRRAAMDRLGLPTGLTGEQRKAVLVALVRALEDL